MDTMLSIRGRAVGSGHPVFIVAEIGNNHDGDVRQGLRLVEEAARCGVDAVKFQAHIADAEMLEDNTVPPHFPEPRYQFVRRMSLSEQAHAELMRAATGFGLIYFCSPFSIEAVMLLDRLNVPCYKVASGEVTNLPMLRAIASAGKPVLVSTGMSTYGELDVAVDELRRHDVPLALLQCTSLYPAPDDALNLRAIAVLQQRFRCPVGFSDHSPDILPSIAAVAMGACIIEKHFTLDRSLYGPDHKASLTPVEMSNLVTSVRRIEHALGDGTKELSETIRRMRDVFQKSVVTVTDVPEGARIMAEMIATKKPGKGIPASQYDAVIGRRTRRAIPANVMIREEDLA